MRLFLPGWEGNSNVKWLRRLKLQSRHVQYQRQPDIADKPSGQAGAVDQL